MSMVFYTHLLDQQMDDPTFVVLTDRRDLDDQLFKTFSDCHKFLRQTPVQATSRENLYELLNNRQSGGIIFTTMAKFEEEWGALSKRKNIIVMADEAHRSQYGLTEKFVTTKDQYGNVLAKTVIGAAKKFAIVFQMRPISASLERQLILKIKTRELCSETILIFTT
ncbi:DEAD/DEAH box helicase family protein [Allobaculum sp. Allo2]|uniref:DEAD/DEAH box helicase family protein n=1 Tax=Allobaculum sp. Allo2 TaxID=2853432 RepID=UPI0034632A85